MPTVHGKDLLDDGHQNQLRAVARIGEDDDLSKHGLSGYSSTKKHGRWQIASDAGKVMFMCMYIYIYTYIYIYVYIYICTYVCIYGLWSPQVDQTYTGTMQAKCAIS